MCILNCLVIQCSQLYRFYFHLKNLRGRIIFHFLWYDRTVAFRCDHQTASGHDHHTASGCDHFIASEYGRPKSLSIWSPCRLETWSPGIPWDDRNIASECDQHSDSGCDQQKACWYDDSTSGYDHRNWLSRSLWIWSPDASECYRQYSLWIWLPGSGAAT